VYNETENPTSNFAKCIEDINAAVPQDENSTLPRWPILVKSLFRGGVQPLGATVAAQAKALVESWKGMFDQESPTTPPRAKQPPAAAAARPQPRLPPAAPTTAAPTTAAASGGKSAPALPASDVVDLTQVALRPTRFPPPDFVSL
jgi:hypothetical protein